MKAKAGIRFDLARCVPMSREEEHRCALAYVKTKDPALAERLVMANMRMVVALAHQYCRVQDDLRDIVQEGNRGLLLALEKYDPTRGIKFCTYAVWWIRAYMWNFTMNNWGLVKIATTQAQRKLFFGLRKERDRLELTGGDANTRELATRLDVKESEVVTMLERFAGGEISLDTPASSRAAGMATLGELLSDPSALGPEQRVEEAELDELLHAKLEAFGATLEGRDAQIFRGRLLSEEPTKLARLAATFGVSRERTRQLEERLKHRIRVYLQKEMGDELTLSAPYRRREGSIALPRANSAVPPLERPIVLPGLS